MITSLIENLVNSIYPRCQKCDGCATRMATYTFLLGGEQYFCDEHSHKDLDRRWSGLEPIYRDLSHALFVRQAKEYIKVQS